MEQYRDPDYAGTGLATPKLRTQSSPDLVIQPRRPSNAFQDGHIFYSEGPKAHDSRNTTPPAYSTVASPRPRASTVSYPTPKETNPINAIQQPTPFYMPQFQAQVQTQLQPQQPSQMTPRTQGRLVSLWSGGSESITTSVSSSPWAAVYEESAPAPRQAIQYNIQKQKELEMGLSQLNWTSNDLSSRVGRMNEKLDHLASRITNLEIGNHNQQRELTKLRILIESSQTPHPHQFRPTTPPPTSPHNPLKPAEGENSQELFTPPPSIRRARTTSTLQPQSPLQNRRSSVPFMTPISTPPSSSSNQSGLDYQSENDVRQSPSDHMRGRRHSRGVAMESVARSRRVSLSAIAPIVAQAKWMAQQQNPSSSGENLPNLPPPVPEEPVYRSLLDSGEDVEPEVFIRRILVQGDQQSSLFLQQLLREATSDEQRLPIFKAVGENLLPLSFSKFGNYLVSSCLSYGGPTVRVSFTAKFRGSLRPLSMDMSGCHVVQKILDVGDFSTRSLVLDELMYHTETFTNKPCSHVWNKLLATVEGPASAFYRKLSETGTGEWAEIARNDSGSLIVQCLLENWNSVGKSVIAKELLADIENIALTQGGSFVAAHLIEHAASPFRLAILKASERLALDHFGAKAVEKCFRRNDLPSDLVANFVDGICALRDIDNRPPILDIASHSSGVQLLSLVLSGSVCSNIQKERMSRIIRAAEDTLKTNKDGSKILALCMDSFKNSPNAFVKVQA